MSDADDRFIAAVVVELAISPDRSQEEVQEELAQLLSDRDGWSGTIAGRVHNWEAQPCV